MGIFQPNDFFYVQDLYTYSTALVKLYYFLDIDYIS